VYLSDRKKSCGDARRQTGWGCNAGRRLARQRNIHGNHSDGNSKGICPYQCSGSAGHDIAHDIAVDNNPDGDVLLRSVGRQPVRIACLDVWGASCLGSSDWRDSLLFPPPFEMNGCDIPITLTDLVFSYVHKWVPISPSASPLHSASGLVDLYR
jgi:hypothetical protein